MIKTHQHLHGKRIGFFGKGGAGKSTSLILFAQALRARGYPVCVLDADSTNIGLYQALGVESPPTPLLDYFGGMVFSGGKVTCPVDDPTRLVGAELWLDDLPPEYYARSPEGIAILSAGKIGSQGPGAGCDGPIAKIARDVVLRTQDQHPITLIDFKAGFEDSARGVMTSLDWAIVTVDPTVASLEIAANLNELVQKIQQDVLPATAHLESPALVALANRLFTEASIAALFVLLNRVPDAAVEDYLKEKLAEKGLEPVGVIHTDASIPHAWLKGQRIQSDTALGEALQVIDCLEEFAAHRAPAV
jgi:CO dehydrogenase nickel-insertion accessory protein CooC1